MRSICIAHEHTAALGETKHRPIKLRSRMRLSFMTMSGYEFASLFCLSSTTSSLTSVAAVSLGGAPRCGAQQRVSDPWLQPQSDRERDSRHERRRSSTMTARYSLFDAFDLEYAR
ncbi:hypothetical protein CVS40_7043 [Lucilia cuprina]|nr:hypothetical protein CVS40_7043 [Lucilia cuprina]